MAMNSEIINYNDGFLSIWKVLFFNANQKDDVRWKNMGRKSLEKDKKRRKTLRSQRKGFIDLEKENEGQMLVGLVTFELEYIFGVILC